MLRQLRLLAIAGGIAALAAGCIVEEHHDHGYVGGSQPGPTGGGGGGGAGGGGGGGGGSTPMLVDIQTGKTLDAQPGDGAGVFIEYQAGGHWHVWWTCDTNKTGAPCAFDVGISAQSGTIANAATEAFEAPDALTTPTPASLRATTNTTTAVDGVRFDTTAGAIITVDAAIGGVRDGRYLFFVQNGQVNGGYTGTLTDPLSLQPTAP